MSVLKQLQDLAKNNPTAHMVLQAFALKERSRAVTDLARFRENFLTKHGLQPDPKAYLAVFQALEKVSVGKLTYSPTGLPRKFKWAFSSRSVGAAAVDGNAPAPRRFTPRAQLPVVEKAPQRKARPSQDASLAAPTTPPRRLVALLRLSKGQVVKFEASDALSPADMREFNEMVTKML